MAPKSKVPAPTKPPEKSINPPVAAQNTATPGIQQTAALAVQAPTALTSPSQMPSWLAEAMGNGLPRGLEKVDKLDLIYPRLVLVQGLTPAAVKGDAIPGEFRDNLSNELLAPRNTRLQVIPVIYSKSRMRFEDFDNGGGILCRSKDSLKAAQPNGKDQGDVATSDCSKCVYKEWDDSAEGGGAPECTEFHNILCLLPEHDMRAIIVSMKSAGSKVAKRLISTLSQMRVDAFATVFSLWSVDEKSSNGAFDYKNYEFEKVGFVTPEQYKVGLALFESMAGKTWEADVSDLEAAPEEAQTDGPPEPGSDVEDAPPPASQQTVDAAPSSPKERAF